MASKSNVQNSESTNIFNNRAANLVSDVNMMWGDTFRSLNVPLFTVSGGQKPYTPALAAILAPFVAKNPNILTEYVGLGWALEKSGITATHQNMVKCALHNRLTPMDVQQIMAGKVSPLASTPTDWFPTTSNDGEQIFKGATYLVGGVNYTPKFLEYRKTFSSLDGAVKNTRNAKLRTTVPGDAMWLANTLALSEGETRVLHSSIMAAPTLSHPFTVRSLRLGDWWVNTPHIIVNNKLLSGTDREDYIMEQLSRIFGVHVVSTYSKQGDVLYMKSGNSSGAVVKKGFFLGHECSVAFFHDSFYTLLPKGNATDEIPHEKLVSALLRAYFAWGFYSFDTMKYECTATIKSSVGSVVVAQDGGQAYYVQEGDCCYALLPNGTALMFLRMKVGVETAVRYNVFTGSVAHGGRRMGRSGLIEVLMEFTGFSDEGRITKVLDRHIPVQACDQCKMMEFKGHSCFVADDKPVVPDIEFLSLDDDATVYVTPAQFQAAACAKTIADDADSKRANVGINPAVVEVPVIDYHAELGSMPPCVAQYEFSSDAFTMAYNYWKANRPNFRGLKYTKGWNYWCSKDVFYVAIPGAEYGCYNDLWYYGVGDRKFRIAAYFGPDHQFTASDPTKWGPFFAFGTQGLENMGNLAIPEIPDGMPFEPGWGDGWM